MAWYAIASLTPAAILAVACLLGGGWAWGALATMTVAIAGLDRLTRVVLPARAGDGAAVAVLLGLVHFVLLFLGVRALSGAVPLTGAQMVALTAALGSFFGQVSNSDAHELIHARNRWRVRLGTAVYVSLLFGHHVSAHLRVHHPHVATPRDPNSARAGEGFYRFWARAWAGSFREGWRAETRLRQGRGLHPYAVYGGGALATLAAASLVGGWRGVAALGVLALWAQTQLLLADYVQHYGLCRETRADGSAVTVAVCLHHGDQVPARDLADAADIAPDRGERDLGHAHGSGSHTPSPAVPPSSTTNATASPLS